MPEQLRAFEEIMGFLDARNAKPTAKHNLWTEQDLIALLELNFGVGIAPRSSALSLKSKQLALDGLPMSALSMSTELPGASARWRRAR